MTRAKLRLFLKHFFLIVTVFYLGIILFSEDVRYEQASVMMFTVALLGFMLTATIKGSRRPKL